MASGGGSNLHEIFEKYARFGKTEAQIKEAKGGLRIETKNIQKLCKESGVLDAKYPSQLLDNDISNFIFIVFLSLSSSVLRCQDSYIFRRHFVVYCC